MKNLAKQFVKQFGLWLIVVAICTVPPPEYRFKVFLGLVSLWMAWILFNFVYLFYKIHKEDKERKKAKQKNQ